MWIQLIAAVVLLAIIGGVLLVVSGASARRQGQGDGRLAIGIVLLSIVVGLGLISVIGYFLLDVYASALR